MKTISYSAFRENLSSILEEVEETNMACIITRRNYPNMVLITEREYNSLKETLYLLSTPANRDALFKSIRQAKNGEFVEVDLDD